MRTRSAWRSEAIRKIGVSPAGRAASRRSVLTSIEPSPDRSWNCLGLSSRDSGHSREPTPPLITKLTILSAIVWLPSSAGASRSLDASSLTKVLSSSIIFSVNCATVGAPIGAAKDQLRRPTERRPNMSSKADEPVWVGVIWHKLRNSAPPMRQARGHRRPGPRRHGRRSAIFRAIGRRGKIARPPPPPTSSCF